MTIGSALTGSYQHSRERLARLSRVLLTEQDIYHFREGTYVRAYEKLGAHVVRATEGALQGTRFAVWAPNAAAVTVIGDFNGWDRHRHPLAARADSSGIWEGVVAGVGPGTLYKYHVASRQAGLGVDKADPYAFRTELPPRTASVVWELPYQWQDAEWLRRRAHANALGAPWSIYELHPGSWRRVPQEHNRFLNYRELAHALGDYVTELGFTHVEQLHLQLRPRRSAQLPRQQRAVLARHLPHRRAARGCRGLDAVSGLRAARRRMDPQRLRRARESRCGGVPQAAQSRRLSRSPRYSDHRRGIDRLADGVAPDLPRRPRLRAQVEHGLDARHPQVFPAGPRAPQVSPQPPHLQHLVRLQRELRAAAVARRGGARQGLAHRQDARGRVAAVREPAPAVRLHVDPPGQEAVVHGRGIRAAARVAARGESRVARAAVPVACRRAALGP